VLLVSDELDEEWVGRGVGDSVWEFDVPVEVPVGVGEALFEPVGEGWRNITCRVCSAVIVVDVDPEPRFCVLVGRGPPGPPLVMDRAL
jgi:hypothetical protein